MGLQRYSVLPSIFSLSLCSSGEYPAWDLADKTDYRSRGEYCHGNNPVSATSLSDGCSCNRAVQWSAFSVASACGTLQRCWVIFTCVVPVSHPCHVHLSPSGHGITSSRDTCVHSQDIYGVAESTEISARRSLCVISIDKVLALGILADTRFHH